MSNSLPERIGRYEIRRELGRGAMGVVFEAHDSVLGRTVALKTIHLALALAEGDRQGFEDRFLAEARAAARLSHAAIVVVYDVGREAESGKLYMALEYLVGKTLEAMLSDKRPLDWREAVRIAGRLAEGLHHAHSNGVIHRDVKPANIMLLESGEPKIMDFGIAKIAAAHLTVSGQIFGSPSYMSPERAIGETEVDGRSDLFSLGAILYELLTGKRAFSGPSLPEILTRVAYEHPPPPAQSVRGLPRDLDDVLARALAKSPADRYPDGSAFAQDLEDVLQGRPPRHRQGWTKPRPEPTTMRTGPQVADSVPAARAPVLPAGEATMKGGSGRAPLSLPPGKRVCLAILAGSRQGEMFPFERPQALIGRAGGKMDAEIEITDPEVSRAHAVVECHGPRIVLRDLGSTNGTFVDLKRITETELEDHAEFRVGGTRFMLILADLE